MIDIYDMTHASEVMRRMTGGRVNTLNSRMGTGGNQVPVVHTVIGALAARDYKGVGNEYVQENKCQVQNNTVRRLTPLECERLQGYPDGWTDIEFQGKPAPDTRRYKAIGNGMAQPCADFVIQRIVDEVCPDVND